MSWVRIAATVTALLALAVAPAAAQATVTSSQITSWTSSEPGTPPNDPYLISNDNQPTTLSVSGTATPGSGNKVDIVCYYGPPPNPTATVLEGSVPVSASGMFSTFNPQPSLKPIAGQACRLRAVPAGDDNNDINNYAGPQVAVSEVAIPVSAVAGGPNANTAYNFYVNDVTFTGSAGWGAAGTNPFKGQVGCGGPFAAPVDPDFDVGNYAIDCMGSLMGDDLGAFGGRSEVQVDGRNAYDAASAQILFGAGTNPSTPASQNLTGFPQTLADHVVWDPSTGLISSHSVESWVECNGQNEEVQAFGTCSSFVPSGVQLERDITTSDGGRVITMTDTWSSTDGKPHVVDLLEDDYVGLQSQSNGARGYEFPGRTSFSEYGPGTDLPGPSSSPGSILVRTNVTAPDGSPSEAVGAITFGTAPSEFGFDSNNEFEEHNALVVPAGGSASLRYIYSVGYSVADVTALAHQAQDRFEPPSVVIGSPVGGTTVSAPSTSLSGIASAGSGVTSLVVDGQTVPVASNGTWTAQVPLSPGANTITAVATDGAGATAQAQVAVVYNPPSPPPPPPPPAVKCKVPKTKGMKLGGAEKTLRRAHCKVGKIKHEKSRTVRSGRVASTTPRSGRSLKAGSKIELFVSKGH
jgi:Glucodextranase, domain B/PASTA domain